MKFNTFMRKFNTFNFYIILNFQSEMITKNMIVIMDESSFKIKNKR